MNNHEFSGYSDETRRDDEWNSLGDVEFRPDAEASNQTEQQNDEEGLLTAEEFVEQNYDIQKIIEKSVYEYGDTNDRDSYIVNLDLAKILSEEEQEEIIADLMSGNPVSDELCDKAKKNLAEMIEDSSLIEELDGDPNLRRLRADNMCGRGRRLHGPKIDEIDRVIENLVWKNDDEFFESEEARSLLTDKDYLSSVYRLRDRVDKARELHPERSEDELSDELASILSGFLTRLVDKGTTDVETLINDPYLRGLHAKTLDLYDSIKNNDEPIDSDLTSLWRSDLLYESSSEYGEVKKKFVERHPEIYTEVDEQKLELEASEIIEKIPDRKFIKIFKAYEKGNKEGDKAVIDELSEYLGLSDNKPKIEYGPAEDGESGSYDERNHTINICIDEGKADPVDKDGPKKAFSLLDFLKPKKVDEEEVLSRIRIVSHELRHAYQHTGKNVPPDKKVLYEKNFQVYMDWTDNGYHAYRSQLIEADAYAFCEKTKEHSKKVFNHTRRRK